MATSTQSGARRRRTVEAVVTVTKFTDSARPFSVIRGETSLAEFVPLHGGDYYARGADTPLRDAAARFVGHLESLRRPNRVVIGALVDESGSMSGNDAAVIQGINDFVAGMAEVKKIDPKTAGTVLAVITTDGLENASREISSEALTDLVAHAEEDGFTFIFLGANIDAWGTGRGTVGLSGGLRGQTVSYVNTPKGTSSAMANVTSDAMGYLGDMGGYQTMRSATGTTSRSVTEDGTETTTNINAPSFGSLASTPGPVSSQEPVSSPYSDVGEALKKARGEES